MGEGCTYFLYTKKHTQTYASYPAMDISCIYNFKERDVDLEVEGMRYYTDASRAANILDPPHSRGGDLEIEGEVNVSL